jgi:hypothetical protein
MERPKGLVKPLILRGFYPIKVLLAHAGGIL